MAPQTTRMMITLGRLTMSILVSTWCLLAPLSSEGLPKTDILPERSDSPKSSESPKIPALTLKSHLSLQIHQPLAATPNEPKPLHSVGERPASYPQHSTTHPYISYIPNNPNNPEPDATPISIYVDELFKEMVSGLHIPLHLPLPLPSTAYGDHYYSKQTLVNALKKLNIPLDPKHIIGQGITLTLYPPTRTRHHENADHLAQIAPRTKNYSEATQKSSYPSTTQSKGSHHTYPTQAPVYHFYIPIKWETAVRAAIESTPLNTPTALPEQPAKTPPQPQSDSSNATFINKVSSNNKPHTRLSIPARMTRNRNGIILTFRAKIIALEVGIIAFTAPFTKTPQHTPGIIGHNIFFQAD